MDAINANAIILYTASKFFRSPPFCGAVIVPLSIMDELQNHKEATVPQGLNAFVGKSEIPSELKSWRESVPDSANNGLALRWEAGLAEIEPTLAIAERERIVAEA
jgi:hypothetical protein